LGVLDISFDEFQLEFIPLDEDVLNLELPGFLKDYFLVSKFIKIIKEIGTYISIRSLPKH